MPSRFVIAIPIYPGVDLLDVAAPKEVFKCMGDSWGEREVQTYLVAESRSPLATRDGTTLTPDRTFDDDEVAHVDLLWVPGGAPDALVVQMKNRVFRDFLVERSRDAEYVTSVCEGALIAANAGLFDGYRVTTHWAFVPCLEAYPEVEIAPGTPSFWHDRNRVTGGGISSGIDESLYLVKLVAGESIAAGVRQFIQYFPNPPVYANLPGCDGCPVPGGLPVEIDS